METSGNKKEAYMATKEQVAAQLMMIETVHGIRLVNRDRLIDTIAINAGDRRTASFVTAAINSWVTVSGIEGEAEVPDDLLARIFRNFAMR